MKSVVAAKAVLFPEAEENDFCRGIVLENAFVLAAHCGAKIVVNMEGEQHENHGVVASLATPAATFPKISGLLSSA